MPLHALTPELLARLEGVPLRVRTIVDHVLSGQHRGRQRGASIDFAEHRQYVPGDDIRNLDWKLLGKRDRLHVRQYEQDARLKVWLLLDTSPSMSYRSESAELSKLEYAACLAGVWGWLGSRQHDDVALASFSETGHIHLSPQGGAAAAVQLMQSLEAVCAAHESLDTHRKDEANTARLQQFQGLNELASRIAPGALVLILTDALGDMEALLSAVSRLRHARCDVRLIQVLDQAELEFPFDQEVDFVDLESAARCRVKGAGIREAYQAEINRFLAELESTARGQGIAYQRVVTDQFLDQACWSLLRG